MSTRVLAAMLALAVGQGLVGCAARREPEEPKRSRMDEILKPSGAKPGEADTKHSRYEGKTFQSKQLKTKPFNTGHHAYKEHQGFNVAAYQKNSPFSKQSRYATKTSSFADDKARTFASRYDNQSARTKDYAQADKDFDTKDYRESDKGFHTGRNRYYSPGSKVLAPTQIGHNAAETANLYSTDKPSVMNEEAIRRILNKEPKEE